MRGSLSVLMNCLTQKNTSREEIFLEIIHKAHSSYTSDYIDEHGMYPHNIDTRKSKMREAVKKLFRDHHPDRDEVVKVIKNRRYEPELEHIFN